MKHAGKKRVLVVDDEADMRTFVATVLETSGFDVAQAEDGRSALALAEKDPPDAIVLDIMMPRIEDGMQAFLSLRSDARTGSIPVIMLSAIARKTFFHALKNLVPESSGAVKEPDGYMEKPPDAADLLALVKRVLA